MPLSSVRSFVADNTRATYGEDSGRASDCSWVDTPCLRYAAVVLQSGAAEIYVPAQDNPGSQSPVALVQARSNARAKQGMQATSNGCVAFREWLGGDICLVWRDVLAANPTAVLEACYSEAHVFISEVLARRSAAWVRCVESGRVSPQSLSAAFWLSTAPLCQVEPEPVFTCHFSWHPCVGWGPHLWYQCSCAVWGAGYVFASALTLLPCDGRVWHSPHRCFVYRSDRAVVWALAHECAFPGLV